MEKYEQLSFDLGIKNDIIAENRMEQSLSLSEKIEISERALKVASDMSKKYYKDKLILAYSGGKDSAVLLRLAENCLGKDEYEVMYSHTSVDYPESVYYIRKEFERLNKKGIKATINYPKDKNGNHETMWTLIPKINMLPTRLVRRCCQTLKETSTPNRICCTGVRASESTKRQGRDIFAIRGETYKDAKFYSLDHAEEVHRESQEIQDDNWDCTLIKNMKEHNDVVVNPIYDWNEFDVWDYIKQENIEVNPLYAKGWQRVGCILCPMTSYKNKLRQIEEYPTYAKAYIHACDKLLEQWRSKGKETEWKTGEEMFNWWIERDKHEVKGQMNLFN